MGLMDEMMKPSARYAKFQTAGDSYSGVIAAIVEAQATEFGTNAPLFFDDGKPKMMLLVIIATSLREDEDDDGLRTVPIKAWGIQRSAFRDAVTKGGEPELGDQFAVRFIGEGERSARGGFPPKKFEYRVTKTNASLPF